MNNCLKYSIFEEGFKSCKSYDDGRPLISARHPVFIKGIQVTGPWLDLYDAILEPFRDRMENGSWTFISPEHEKQYNKIMSFFEKVFVKFNRSKNE